MKKRYIHVMARSNSGTCVQLTFSAETDDLRSLIIDALVKLAQYGSSSQETFLIEHIDSISHLHDPKI